MKITDVKLYVLENPDSTGSILKLKQVPNLRRIQYEHGGIRHPDKKQRQHFIEVSTDEGITSRCTTEMRPEEVEILRANVEGEDPFGRERLYQMLHKGTRWLYLRPGWFGDFDNCLWDIAGKAAGLPVYSLIGKVRERFPVYLTGGSMPIEGYLKAIEEAKEASGINAYKFHSSKGGRADMPMLQEVRDIVGPDYTLLHDPVCSYDLREAIEVGHLMEELDFVWLEEPLHEYKMHQYQELCRELTIPVMSNETLMADIGISTQWLMHGATDRLRGNARNGTTQVLKMAHFAEMYDTNIELNGHGGLFGHVHAHLGCSIDNTDYYECSGRYPNQDGHRKAGALWGITNAPLIQEGHIAPNDLPGWGAEWDEEVFQSRVVAVH